MISAYRVFVAADIVAKLRTFRSRERHDLIRLFEQLAEDPFRPGDYVETDEIGRPVQVLIIGSHAVCFWADHAVREVKVLELTPVGR
jgi:hypothetical protein